MKKIYCYLTAIMLCFYGLSNISDIAIIIALTVFLIVNIKNDIFFFTYFGLIFFEPILKIPYITGSFFRIYHALFLLRLIYDIKEKKAVIDKKNIIVFSGVLLIITGILYQPIVQEISTIVNVFIIVYIFCGKKDNKKFYEELLYYMGIFLTFNSIYGLFRGKRLDFGTYKRLCTTIEDPNYSALFINIGIFSILNNNIFEKKEKYICLAILGILLLLTVSLTGIFAFIIFYTLYCFLNKNKKGIMFLLGGAMVLIIILLLPINKDNILYGIHQRIINIKSGIVTDISSGRTKLIEDYMNEFTNLPLYQWILGGNNTVSGQFRDYIVSKIGNVSHNSYVDMLFMTGIIGTIILITTYLYGVYILFKQYKNKEVISINYIILKLILLFFSMTLSIFPYRYFIAIFLFNILNKKEKAENENTLDSKHYLSISSKEDWKSE